MTVKYWEFYNLFFVCFNLNRFFALCFDCLHSHELTNGNVSFLGSALWYMWSFEAKLHTYIHTYPHNFIRFLCFILLIRGNMPINTHFPLYNCLPLFTIHYFSIFTNSLWFLSALSTLMQLLYMKAYYTYFANVQVYSYELLIIRRSCRWVFPRKKNSDCIWNISSDSFLLTECKRTLGKQNSVI